MRAASATVNGKAFIACWIGVGDEVHLLYEDGDLGVIPRRDFKLAPTV
jgi:hypothetical protein